MGKTVIDIEELERDLEELKIALNLERMKLSKSAGELMEFVNQGEKDDFFVNSKDKVNMFRDRNGPCSLL